MLRVTRGGSGCWKGIYNIPKPVLYQFTLVFICYGVSPLSWSFQESTVVFPSAPPNRVGRRAPLKVLGPLLKRSWTFNHSWITERGDGLLGPTKCWLAAVGVWSWGRELELGRQSANASSVSFYVRHESSPEHIYTLTPALLPLDPSLPSEAEVP